MASMLRCRSAIRRNAGPLGLSLSTGLFMISRQQPLRMDALDSIPSVRPLSTEPKRPRRGGLDPETMQQLSGGSMAGFLAGVLVSFFSRTLVLLLGLGIVAIQVASRYGIDVVDRLKLKQRVQASRVLSALSQKPVLKISFGLAFASSAFMSF